MTVVTYKGICPECEFTFQAPELERGETLACPECLLTLRVEDIQDQVLAFKIVEAKLTDWGE